MANIIEGIQSELARVREVLKYYEEIPQGQFGALMIKRTIAEAESAVAHGDVVEMIRTHQDLKEITG